MNIHRGFTLIEVLVTVVILAIGLLGLAGMQIVTLQRESGSTQRIEAVNRAYDLLDRMRANRSQALAGRYNVELGATPSGATLADTDVRIWKQTLAAELPDGDASVLVEDSVVSINIVWSDAGDAGNPVTLNLRTQL
ncbi:type IV pilus modification protein PilV [Fontimonas sp. SYSU GA230001]|uniref:type IV pilus modification protein PilV n=1 Tax=Fontimonas sp. SYSU GA230001 TaxID=3142450 RepID=UPI0032B58AC5